MDPLRLSALRASLTGELRLRPGTNSVHVRSHAAVNLGRKLFPLFARALDLPEDFFNDKVCASVCGE